ncbi:MAG: transposase, partial [Candidatus Omnitrophota bacterium]
EWFGHKENGAIILNEFGETAKRMWLAIPRHFHGIKLDEFVIMPDHIHGIIIIDNVGTRHALSLPIMIGSFKSAVSRYMHYAKNESDFEWQRSFYDHVIRNERSLMHVREYVLRNSPAEFGLW